MSQHDPVSLTSENFRMSRVRTRRTFRTPHGRAKRVLSGTVVNDITQQEPAYGTYSVTRDVCTDELGFGVDHGLAIEKVNKDLLPINGKHSTSPNTYWEYVEWYWNVNQAFPAHLSVTLPSEGADMATAMARSNPNRSDISLPTFIGEMKDFPATIRQLGKAALLTRKNARNLSRKGQAKEAAGLYLAYRFAIAPLISDLRKIINFQDSVQKRMHELDRLYSKGGLKRRINLSTTSASAVGSTTIATEIGITLTCKTHTMTSVRRWATVRWLPTTKPSFKTDDQKRKLARKLVFGLNAFSLGLTAWELLPWSWLADWFFNVQSLLEAHANTVPATCVHRNLMTYWKTSVSYSRTDAWTSVFRGGDGTTKAESKLRSQPSLSLNSSFPLLSGKQLSILGALSVSKGIR
jgi:hypothetical protein